MAELEVHAEAEGGERDPLGKKVGVMAAVIAVFLAVVTIISHRAHTDAVLMKSEANDKWSYFQSKRIKYHNLELGQDMIGLLGGKSAEAEKLLAKYSADKEKYTKDSDAAQEAAKKQDEEAAAAEGKALYYDFGEGLLEIGMVLTSLYFISKSKLFPVVGGIGALAGLGIAVVGYLK